MKSKLTIYTISTFDDTHDCGVDYTIGGSYLSRDRALDELTNWVMERLSLRDDIVYAFAHDVNHPEMENAVDWLEDYGFTYILKNKEEVRSYVRAKIAEDECYHIFRECINDLFVFSLDENDLELDGNDEIAETIAQITKNAK